MFYISIIKTNEEYFIPCLPDGKIKGWETLNEAVEYYEGSYRRAHKLGHSWSMSACINYLFFEPSIIRLENTEDLTETIVKVPYKLFKVNHISGNMLAIKCDGSNIQSTYDNGVKPKLLPNDKENPNQLQFGFMKET